jgi:hypothetical protein
MSDRPLIQVSLPGESGITMHRAEFHGRHGNLGLPGDRRILENPVDPQPRLAGLHIDTE